MKWRLRMTPPVQAALRTLPPQTKGYIRQACDDLCRDPWQGKSLRDELAGYYSLRAKRFRVVYEIQRQTVTVIVVGIGPRKTIYGALAAAIHLQRRTIHVS